MTNMYNTSSDSMSTADSLIDLTKKLLVHPPTLSSGDLHLAISIILNLLKNVEKSSDSDELVLKQNVIIGSFLTALRTTGLDHKAEYIAEAARAVLAHSATVNLETSEKNALVLDIVGTGGDGQNTFNVSTSAAIVASGIPGFKVCKHGGKASTSNSGAGDMIIQLGCDVSKVTNATVPQLWDANSFLFLLAPYFHNGMKLVAQIRKLLGIPTIFNVLGPLLHPVSHVNRRVLGVYSKELAPEYAKAAAIVYPSSETFVVWGQVGLDEVAPIGKSTIWHVNPILKGSQVNVFEVEPSMFGLDEHDLSQCKSLGPLPNAKVLKEEILSGKRHLGDNDPIYDYVLLNTAVLYCLCKGHTNWKEGISEAEQSIHSGKALASLEQFIDHVKLL